jgi:signal transduction histidine kinase
MRLISIRFTSAGRADVMRDAGAGSFRHRLGSVFTSLRTKFIAALILLATVVIGLFSLWGMMAHRAHMQRATQDKVRALAQAVDASIRDAMREGRIPEVQSILTHLAEDPDIERIAILDTHGKILRASRPELVGRSLDRDRISRVLVQPDLAVARYFEGGRSVQTVIKRIENRPECSACHPPDQPTIGILHLDMSFRQAEEQTAQMEWSAIWMVLLTAAALAGGGVLLVMRLVERPLHDLMGKMALVERGDLSVRADEGRGDELGRLAGSFNAMVDRMQAARAEIEQYHQQRLARAERLATLGELAASVAHEIKNPLAGIAGAVQILAEELPDGDPRREIMGEILAQIRRLDGSVRDLLAFARPARPELHPCDLRRILDRVLLVVAEDETARDVRVIREYQADLPQVPADEKLLQQVFFNLVLNAAQAMAGRGTITLGIAFREVGAGGSEGAAAAGPCVEVRVADTGPGIAPAALREIFTPFFTTKPRGIGLGLAIARRIVEDHGGRIWAESLPGRGAAFTIRLPVSGGEEREGAIA